MGFFDDFLKQVPAEDQAILNKYPQLQASVSKMETDLEKKTIFTDQWRTWQEQHWDRDAGMTVEEKRLSDELAATTARLNASITSGASNQTIDTLRKEMNDKLAETQRSSMAAIEGMNFFYREASNRLLPHQREFKEDLDPAKLMAYMHENKIQDPALAYDRMVAPRRAEIAAQASKDAEAQRLVDIAEAEKRGREAAAKEYAMGPNGMSPTDQTGGIAGVTAHIAPTAKVSDELKQQIADAKPGDGTLAALGYKMHREGAFA